MIEINIKFEKGTEIPENMKKYCEEKEEYILFTMFTAHDSNNVIKEFEKLLEKNIIE